jgi:hypothetical protein
MKTSTQKTLKFLRDLGHEPEVVEHYNSFTKQRKDLFGFADIISPSGHDIWAVQTFTTAWNQHIDKLKEDIVFPKVVLWLNSGGRILFIGWRKVKKKRGGKQMVWRPRLSEIFIEYGEIIQADAPREMRRVYE